MTECGPLVVADLLHLHQEGYLNFVPDEEIDAERFLALVAAHDIGDGELECIVVCSETDRSFCTDDGPARALAKEKLGSDRVLGGLRLLRWCVEDGLDNCDNVFQKYLQMKILGAFLPEIEQEFFCPIEGEC
jgi:hypothetical protein